MNYLGRECTNETRVTNEDECTSTDEYMSAVRLEMTRSKRKVKNRMRGIKKEDESAKRKSSIKREKKGEMTAKKRG